MKVKWLGQRIGKSYVLICIAKLPSRKAINPSSVMYILIFHFVYGFNISDSFKSFPLWICLKDRDL